MSKCRRVLGFLPLIALLLLLIGVVPVLGQDEVTLTVALPGHHAARVAVVEEQVDEFVAVKAAEGVTVNVELVQSAMSDTDYQTQLALDFGAGVGPDVYAIDSFWIPQFAESGYALPLDDRLAEWEEWAAFFPGMQDIGKYNDQTYAVMTDTDVRMLWYRKDIFEQAGLPVPFEPQSWQDIFDAAAAIKENVPDVWPIAFQAGTPWGEGTTMQGFYMWFLGAGGQLYDFEDSKWVVDSPALRQALQIYEDMFVTNEYAPVEPFLESQPWIGIEQVLFHDGQVAMMTNGSWMWGGAYGPEGAAPLENRDEVIGWAPMPAMEPGAGLNGQDFVSISGGWAWSLNPASDNPDLAWEFVQYVTSAEEIGRLNTALQNVVTREDAMVSGDDPYLADASAAVMPFTTFRPALPEYNQVSSELQLATERIITGEATAEEALEMFGQAVEEIVGAENVKRIE